MSTSRLAIASLLLMGALLGSASGTLLLHLSDEQMGRRADAVVRAEVLDTESYRDTRRQRVFTNTTLGVLEYLKGSGPDQILVETAGGVVGELEYRVLGSPDFTPGEEVVLFLEARASVNRVIGMTQGKLRVIPQTDGTSPLLERDLSSVAFVDNGRIGDHAEGSSHVRLDELRALLRRLRPTVDAPAPRALAPAPFSM